MDTQRSGKVVTANYMNVTTWMIDYMDSHRSDYMDSHRSGKVEMII